jgi:hypothetical protein
MASLANQLYNAINPSGTSWAKEQAKVKSAFIWLASMAILPNSVNEFYRRFALYERTYIDYNDLSLDIQTRWNSAFILFKDALAKARQV